MSRAQRKKNEERKEFKDAVAFCSCTAAQNPFRITLDCYPAKCGICRRVVWTPSVHAG